MTPIPYVEHRTIHHAPANVEVHDVYDGGCGDVYYTTGCGGYAAAPVQYVAPVAHVHHGHHVAHTAHVHHVHHVHHKKEDLELKLMAGAALDKLNQKDEADEIKNMAAGALAKISMPQPGVKEMAAKALKKIDSPKGKGKEIPLKSSKKSSNAQVSDKLYEEEDNSIETL